MNIPAPDLVDWYGRARRDLPWRVPTVTAWQILVSEFMLQQTPVARVAPIWLEWVAPRLARWFFLLAPAVISIALYVREPAMEWYAGLSGMDVGVLVLLALWQLRPETEEPRWFWIGVLLLVALKVFIEATSGRSLAAEFAPGARVVPLAHVGGVVCALVAFVAARRFRFRVV